MLSFLANCWRQLVSSPAEVAPRSDSAATKAEFDAQWYLAAYPDVAQAGIDPWEHYLRHGAEEGRLPRRNRALAWDHALWRGAHAVMLPRLHALLDDAAASADEQRDARWALARWFAWQQQWEKVATCLLAQRDPKSVFTNVEHPRMALLAVEALCRLQLEDKLPTTFSRVLPTLLDVLKQRFPDQADTYLAEANSLMANQDSDKPRLEVLNHLFATHDLSPIAQQNTATPLALDNLTLHPSQLAPHNPPLISVIVPLYNAQHTVATALRSLLDQQGVRLEIIVVDDASQDGSVDVVEQWQANTPAHISLRLIRHSVNQGAYAARNTGLAVACGEFITTHDSDDWSHPQKLALQCQALLNDPSLNACLSHWVRVTPELLFHRWRLDEYGWVYPNMSSLMFRRSVRDTLGYWDNVSVNADSEYRLRIEAAYGPESLQEVLPGVPLAFGRADEGSLSQHTRSHLASQFAGMRFHYMQAAQNWHQEATNPTALYMPQTPEVRAFIAPQAMLRSTAPANTYHYDYERVIGSALFDAGWYLERYIDLQQVLIEPLCHFWESGAQEGRDPGPNFSTSGYLRANAAGLASDKHPLVHYLSQDNPDIQQALPVWEGQRSFAGRPNVMLCGHQAGGTLFGAERSLLDVLEAMGELRWNVVVTLPEANNAAYEQHLLSRCKALAVLPYGWWQVGRIANEDTVAHFQTLLRRYRVQAVHGNTVVLQEPYVAARREGIATLVHVRELPAYDTALCDLLGATADEVVDHVHRHADVIIANSHCVAQVFSRAERDRKAAAPISVVPNTIETAPLLALPEVSFMANDRVRVGMLSSNVAKKGLTDIETMAMHLQMLAPQVDVVLYGPLTAAIKSLQYRQTQGQAPGNLIYAGYVEAPATALAELHIVVNLSRFQESFGRTVLEAMAAGRPVVAYDWGALNELVQNGDTGYLVPYATPLKAAQQVAKLAKSPARCVEMGQAGRRRAQRYFSATTLRNALANAYEFSQVPEFINTSSNG